MIGKGDLPEDATEEEAGEETEQVGVMEGIVGEVTEVDSVDTDAFPKVAETEEKSPEQRDFPSEERPEALTKMPAKEKASENTSVEKVFHQMPSGGILICTSEAEAETAWGLMAKYPEKKVSQVKVNTRLPATIWRQAPR